jgi:hypothetical protein
MVSYNYSYFNPLDHVFVHDDFDSGLNGWVELTPNFRFDNFEPRKGPVDLAKWGPIMLSSASFRFVGTHGSLHGLYSLKLATRKAADIYQNRPAPGSQSLAIKRLTLPPFLEKGEVQIEAWFAYKPEQDRIGLGEKDIRAFGFMMDIQHGGFRAMPAIRYVNSVNGELKQAWQFAHTDESVSDEQWEYGKKGWCVAGIDPQWFGRRYDDGSTDGFKYVPNGAEKLCYNESDDKINWLYFRMKVNVIKKCYVEFQCGNSIYNMNEQPYSIVEAYNNIDNLFNPVIWIENDTKRRSFLFVDSVLISVN